MSMQAKQLTAQLVRTEQGLELRSPGVGYWRDGPAAGALVAPGVPLGNLEVLGVLHPLRAPPGAHGVIVASTHTGPALARRPVEYGALLCLVDPQALLGAAAADEGAEEQATGTVFRSPSSGRFYRKPAPDKPAFLAVGQEISTGHVVGLLEVMKTFNRLAYGGDGLPANARVLRILPEDGADVDEGDPLVELEPL